MAAISVADSAASLKRDRVVRRLKRVANTHPDRIRAGGERVMRKIRARMDKLNAKRRKEVLRRHELLELAFEAAHQPLLRDGHVRSFDPTTIDKQIYISFYKYLRLLRRRNGGVIEAPAVEAYIDAFRLGLERFAEKDSAKREDRLSLLDGAVEDQRMSLDPSLPDISATPPYQLAQEAIRRVRSQSDSVLGVLDWWEAAALVLLIEAPDVSPGLLGFEGVFKWGEWNKPGAGLFDHRDGMRCYMGRDAKDRDRDRADQEFWLFAERIAEHLEDAVDDTRLTQRHIECMQAMWELGAKSLHTKRTGTEIEEAVAGGGSGNFKQPLASLSKWGYALAKKGPGGGYWLSTKGVAQLRVRGLNR